MTELPTPLEHHQYQRYSSSGEIEAYLTALATAGGPYARLDRLGSSAHGRPLHALICSAPRRAGQPRLRVMLVGSQHGASEAAGCEALLMLARAVLIGDLQECLDTLEFVFIPNANPDGRESDSSRNGNEVNINRDFVLLSQPETAALDDAVLRYEPEVILDAHESASLKTRTLGREGYLTDFEAQFDMAASPAVAPALREYGEHELLPALLAAVQAQGLRAQRYIREITSTRQPITHGGLTARKFRNKAGLRGALTVLLETPMEPKDGSYPSYRNIAERVARQTLCMRAFLAVISRESARIAQVVATAERLPRDNALPLNGVWVRNPSSPEVVIELRRREDYLREAVTFEDWRWLEMRDPLLLPRAYVITAHTAVFASLLSRHQLLFEILDEPTGCTLERERYRGFDPVEGSWNGVETERAQARAEPGSLLVPMTSRSARLLPLLLEPRSQSSVFRYLAYARLLEDETPLFVARIPRDAERLPDGVRRSVR
ncbi:MAG: hypothetical protein RL434_1999 [Pseudomonadota bacterium]